MLPRETLSFEEKKINCLPRDQFQSDLLYNLKFEAGNSLNLAVTAVFGQHPWAPPLDPQLLKVFSFTVLFPCCTVEVPWFLEYHLEKQVIAWEFSKLDLMNCGENTKHTLVRIFFSSFIFWSFLTFR